MEWGHRVSPAPDSKRDVSSVFRPGLDEVEVVSKGISRPQSPKGGFSAKPLPHLEEGHESVIIVRLELLLLSLLEVPRPALLPICQTPGSPIPNTGRNPFRQIILEWLIHADNLL